MKVQSIQDGDTFTIAWIPSDTVISRIRLADIDAPERGEPLHREAREHLGHLLRSAPLNIELTSRAGNQPDPCNRIQAWVWAGNVLINEQMVIDGMAVVWCPRGPSGYNSALIVAEQCARSAELGVWSMSAHRLCDVYNRRRRHLDR